MTMARALGVVRWAWLACAAALVAHGLIATAREVRRWSPGRFTGPMASTDHMLSFLDLPRASEAVRAALDGTPEGEAVLFVGRASAPAFAQTYYGVGNVALPRPVADLRCGEPGVKPLRQPDPSIRYGAVVLYEPVRTIDDPRAVKVGDRLAVIRGRPQADLASYCSAVVPAPSGAPSPAAPGR